MKKLQNKDLKQLFSELKLSVNNQSIFEIAFTHRSYLNETNNSALEHNERIEYLGDAVLELIISEYLFKKYPEKKEGELTSYRSATVKKPTLAQVARTLKLGEYLKMSNGEEVTGGRDKDYLLANSLEAFIGAIYLDSGYEKTKVFVLSKMEAVLSEIVEKRLDIDNKSKFQELSQSKFKITPSYRLISDSGPDHEKTFTMAVYVGAKKFGEGQGNTKQKAEEEAAKEGIKRFALKSTIVKAKTIYTPDSEKSAEKT